MEVITIKPDKVIIKISKDCNCVKKDTPIPGFCQCINNKNLCLYLKKKNIDQLVISREGEDTISWFNDKLTTKIDIYNENTAYFKEYTLWLDKFCEELLNVEPKRFSKPEIFEIRKFYEKNQNNPYILYYLKNLEILTCIELPLNILILPPISNDKIC